MPRLFVAVDLPENIKKDLSSMCFGIPGAKWINPDQIHLTLRFIGEVDGGVFKDIREALAGVKAGSFNLELNGVGCFPPRKAPKVLWVGLKPSPELQHLKKRVDSVLTRIGLEPEGRKYAPHITLARLRDVPLKRLTNFLAGNALFNSPPFQVENFYIYSSLLTPKGAIHKQEASYSLKNTLSS